MRFERLLRLAGFPRKALGGPPASGPDAGKASKTAGASRADRSTDFQPSQIPGPPARNRESGIRSARVSAPVRLLAALGLMVALLAASSLQAPPLYADVDYLIPGFVAESSYKPSLNRPSLQAPFYGEPVPLTTGPNAVDPEDLTEDKCYLVYPELTAHTSAP